MVEELWKWHNALEELVQCPVCLNISQDIIQCINGHHVCKCCIVQLTECPTCKSSFIATRNLVAEQLAAKLHDIKLSLLHPYHELNRSILHNKVCVATQTEVVCVSSVCQTEPINQEMQSRHVLPRNVHPAINLAPRVGKGLFPCRIHSCTVELPHGKMIPHFRAHHNDVFFEFAKNTVFNKNVRHNIFKKQLSFNYHLNQNYDSVFYIKEMGLFFLKISKDWSGNITAYVQIVNCADIAKQYIYTLKIVGTFDVSYTGPVKSCRVSPDRIFDDYLYINNSEMRVHMIDDKGFFHCHFTIKRRFDSRNKPIAFHNL